MNIIEFRNVSRSVTEPSGDGLLILEDVSFSIREGEIFTIIGPSGSGKSSILRLMNRLDEPSSGEILFRGKPLVDYPPQLLRRKVALSFQRPKLFGPKVADDLKYPYQIDSRTVGDDLYRKRRAELVGLIGLGEEFPGRDVDRLSGGGNDAGGYCEGLDTAAGGADDGRADIGT